MDKSKIIPIWQPVGFSTHIIAKKVSQYYEQTTSHTGTVDPMAEGVVIVLVGDERNKKYEYAKWQKEYVFEVAFGIKTDSYDGLGLTEDTSIKRPDTKELLNKFEDIPEEFIGDYTQDYPPYSAKSVEGKPLHWYARKNKLDEVTIPQKSGEIYDLEVLEKREETLSEIVSNVLSKVEKVTGNLRQEKVKQNWQDILEANDSNQKIPIVKFRVVMSKGLYIRSLSQDIAEKLNANGFVYSLVRTRNGAYTKQNSKKLEEIFGSRFRDEYDFVSRSMA